MQNVQFSMNSKGGELFSEALVQDDILSTPRMTARILNFCQPCYMFIREKGKEKPYFMVKINTNFIETIN